MPSNLLNVPHFQQELDSSCVPACVRMILAHYGDLRTEAEFRSLFDTRLTGTRAGNLMRLSGADFEVYLRPSNLVELQAALSNVQPAMIFLKTGALDYWTTDVFHTVVLVGFDTAIVTLQDPYFATGPQTTSVLNFEKAWAQTGQFTAFIRRRQKP